ncbi:hypothetical protein XI02_04875 [Bradyrhizobium sp. CCBAU 21365]|nr:hypothetical protein XI02_04875 [Bradyrhizobium sp. CCBAU 21365]
MRFPRTGRFNSRGGATSHRSHPPRPPASSETIGANHFHQTAAKPVGWLRYSATIWVGRARRSGWRVSVAAR